MTALTDDQIAKFQLIGALWIAIGAMLMLGISLFAIAHYGFGAPVHVRNGSRQVSIPLPVIIGLFEVAGIATIAGGRALRRCAEKALLQL